MPFDTRLYDLADELLTVAAAAMDPADLPGRQFVSPGPDWAHDLGCSFLVVDILGVTSNVISTTSGLTGSEPFGKQPQINVGRWRVTYVLCPTPEATVNGGTVTVPPAAEYDNAARLLYGIGWDLYRGVRAANKAKTLWESDSCQNIELSDLDFFGPQSFSAWATFTVTADLI